MGGDRRVICGKAWLDGTKSLYSKTSAQGHLLSSSAAWTLFRGAEIWVAQGSGGSFLLRHTAWRSGAAKSKAAENVRLVRSMPRLLVK